MNTQGHLEQLLARHHDLENRIHEESQYSQRNDLLIHQLKKEKLRLKEEIETLKSNLAA